MAAESRNLLLLTLVSMCSTLPASCRCHWTSTSHLFSTLAPRTSMLETLWWASGSTWAAQQASLLQESSEKFCYRPLLSTILVKRPALLEKAYAHMRIKIQAFFDRITCCRGNPGTQWTDFWFFRGCTKNAAFHPTSSFPSSEAKLACHT